MRSLIIVALTVLPFTLFSQSSKYTIVFLHSRPESAKLDKETTSRLMEAHLENIGRLAREGKLLAAGPFEGGGGLFILNTTSLDQAEEWVKSDPAVQAGRWKVEYLPYTPRIGSICPVSEPYEMVSYAFVRFNAVVEKFTASHYPALIRKHDAFVEANTDPSNIVTEAIFGANEGGILILKGEIAADAFARDPGVQEGLLDVQMKKLYIAKGSFCE